MKNPISSLLVLFLSFFIAFGNVSAQQFQWVKGGGTSEDLTSAFHSESVQYMCTDPNGNVYALSVVGNNPIIADTFNRPSGAYGANNNLLVTSYNCSGQMRWAKLIAATNQTIPFGIAADSLGHIYVAGNYAHTGGTHTLYIGYDTSISGTLYGSVGLIQLDTTGHFNWIRFIGNNTLATLSAVGSLADPLTIDGTNNAHFFCYMKSGVPLMASVISSYGVYDMTYDSGGTLLNAVRLDLDSQWYLRGGVIDPITNKLYVCGEVNQSFGAGVDTFFAAAFDANRNSLWQHASGGGDGIEGLILDQSKHLVFCGAAGPYSGETRFVFNNDSVLAPYDELSIIMKTDTNGTVDWIRHYDSHTSVNYFISITELPNNKVAVSGTYVGQATDGIDSVTTPTGEGWNPYFVIVDSSGDLLTMQQLHGDGFNDQGTAITSDRLGNIYVGGQVVDSIWGGTIPAYHSVGGNSDFFIMKYGVDCSCTSMPIASYTDTGNHTVGFIYTGTTTSIDSVIWNFGDGSATTTGTNPLHTYTASGTYHACATVYANCGSDIHCSDVVVMLTSDVSAISSGSIKVFPNPANKELNVIGIGQNTSYRLLTITGLSMQCGVFVKGSNALSMKNLAAGIYILEMTGADGERNMVRVVKE